VLDGNVQRTTGSIVLLDASRNPILRWNFRNAWPCKWVGPALNATGNEVAIESIEIAHEGFELEMD
jgi:phage tail-like protein